MKTASHLQRRSELRTPQRGMGTLVNVLFLGVLAGLFMGQSTSAAGMTFIMSLTFAALGISLAFSKLNRYLKVQSERRAAMDLERRMDRLISHRYIKAHGTHSHHPHSVDESESNWIPVARRSRVANRPK